MTKQYYKRVYSPSFLLNRRDIKVEKVLSVFVIVVLILLGLYFLIGKIESPINNNTLLSGESSTIFPPRLAGKYFYGVNVDISQLVPGSPNYFKNSRGEDYIDIAHRLGINIFRIDNYIPNYRGQSTYSVYTKVEWRWVLNKMAKNGIRAIVLIESPGKNPKIYSDQINNSYIDLVNQYILDPEVLSNPDVYAIDLKNEPVLNDNNLLYLKKVEDIIRKKYPKTKFTIGSWKTDTLTKDKNGNEIYNWSIPADGIKILNIIDFYSIHVYGFDKPVSGPYADSYTLSVNYIKQVEQYSGKKPILIEEFGAGNGDYVTDVGSIGGKILQAKAYDGMYRAINSFDSKNVLGAVSYILAQRLYPEGFSIMSTDGNYLYPAAYVLQNYTTGKFNYQIGQDGGLSSSGYLLTNSNSGDLYVVHIGDSVGVELNLPKSTVYKTAFSNSGIVSISEPFQYYNPRNMYEMVFHPLNTGTTTFYVYNDSRSCGDDITCIKSNKVFSVNVDIH